MQKETIQSSKQVDYIIVGQGLCGTFLSWSLMNAGATVLVIDHVNPSTATKVASGVINPVTGRRIVETWRIETLMPFALNAYTAIGQRLGVKLINTCNTIDFHASMQMREAFEKRLTEGSNYLSKIKNLEPLESYFNFHFGAGEIAPCYLIDLNTMLAGWRKELIHAGALLSDRFSQQDCTITEEGVRYKNITAKKIIYCDGVAGMENPFFKNLPYSKIKGEALIVDIPDLPKTNIYKYGLSIVPWSDGYFWVGSSYEWTYGDVLPSASFKTKMEQQLKSILKVPFKIIDHLASERPANFERRPFVGVHPHYIAVAILNGMGTKGCSLAPFFAHQLMEHLLFGKEIFADANVARFSKILQRNFD